MSLRRFLAENKPYWIVPLVLVLGLLAFVLWRSSTSGQPEDDQNPFQYDLY